MMKLSVKVQSQDDGPGGIIIMNADIENTNGGSVNVQAERGLSTYAGDKVEVLLMLVTR